MPESRNQVLLTSLLRLLLLLERQTESPCWKVPLPMLTPVHVKACTKHDFCCLNQLRNCHRLHQSCWHKRACITAGIMMRAGAMMAVGA